MTGWQWHQLDHMQIICTLFQIDNHTSTHHFIFTGCMLFLTSNQQYQSTEYKKDLRQRSAQNMLKYSD